jgi:MoaA/NifB/PqqE/SkfB family radical SAM enzyme
MYELLMHCKAIFSKKDFQAYLNVANTLLSEKHKIEHLTSMPFMLSLDPSSVCNLHCPLCPTGTDCGLREKTLMSFDIYKKVIDELGPFIFFMDLFNWGEPLCNKSLPEMIHYAKRHHMYIRVCTNFSLYLPHDFIRSLVEIPLDEIVISLDGTSQDSNERYRVGSQFDKIIKNIETLVAAKQKANSRFPWITWQFLVFRHNEREINDAKRIARKIGINQLRFEAPYIDIAQDQFKDWPSTITRYNKYSEGINDTCCNKNVSPNASIDVTVDTLVQNNIEEKALNEQYRKLLDLRKPVKQGCDWLWMASSINSNGNVSPCCALYEEKHDFGTICDTSFRQVWNDTKYRAARSLFSKGHINGEWVFCANCPVPEMQSYVCNQASFSVVLNQMPLFLKKMLFKDMIFYRTKEVFKASLLNSLNLPRPIWQTIFKLIRNICGVGR